MIRIAHLIETANARAGGTTTAFLGIINAIATQRDQVQVTAYFQRPTDGDPMWDIIKADPTRYRFANTRGKFFRPAELGHMIAGDLKAGQFDVLHLHGLWGPDLAYAASAARQAGVATIWQSHGMLLRWAMNHKKWKKKACLAAGLGRELRAADGFIAMTQNELEDSVFPPSCRPERRYLVPLPVDIPASIPDRAVLGPQGRRRYALPPDAFVFAFLGRLHPVKRVSMTIDAFAAALPKIGSARLLILGKGDDDTYEQELHAQCKRLGVTQSVVFGGWLSNDVKSEALTAADALVLNSVIESFGYVLFEAMGAGTPVLVTDSIQLSKELSQAGTAMVTRNTTEALAQGMIEMVHAKDRAAVAVRARQWAMETYSPRAVGEQFLQAYAQIMRANRGRNG
ncbi:MAG: glycosyltransferase [Pyrinomonadaceae bacterium]|nr:glycosyltransferase [Phycisphaerales bacterium]